MKKVLKWIIGILLVLCAAVAIIWRGEIATIASIEEVGDNGYLYTMDFKAPYDLDDVLAKDIDSNPELLDYIIGHQDEECPGGRRER